MGCLHLCKNIYLVVVNWCAESPWLVDAVGHDAGLHLPHTTRSPNLWEPVTADVWWQRCPQSTTRGHCGFELSAGRGQPNPEGWKNPKLLLGTPFFPFFSCGLPLRALYRLVQCHHPTPSFPMSKPHSSTKERHRATAL